MNEKELGDNLVLWKDDLGDPLSFEQIQRLLIRVIDKNQLYYNYLELDDKSVKELLSEDELKFNERFYGEVEA